MRRRASRKLAESACVVLAALAVATAPGAATEDPYEDTPFIEFGRARTQLVVGVVGDVDEESVACWKERSAKSEEGVGVGVGGAEFHYEILIVDVHDVPLRILAPQPTAYRVGDAFQEVVMTARPSAFVLSPAGYREDTDRFRVRFDDMVRRYARFAQSVQGGYLVVNGVMEREQVDQR